MTPSDRMFVVGLNHLNASVASREKAVVSSTDLPSVLKQLQALVPLDEVVILSTCSRVDIFAICADPSRGRELVRAWFASRAGADIRSSLYEHEGADALRHLFRVASGLDSWIIGETEILAQVKKAYQSALAGGFTRRNLNRAFQSAIAAGKDVRSATGIQNGIHSIGGATAMMAKRIFGDKAGGGIVVFGAGQTAEAVVRHLAAKKFDRIVVANRTVENARAIADNLGGTAVGLDEGLAHLDQAEVAVFSASVSEPLLTSEFLARLLPRRRSPLFLVDLGVPRNVSPACAKLESVYLYDLDDLKRMISDSMAGKLAEKDRAEELSELAMRDCRQEMDKPPRVAPAANREVAPA
ncbi:MAG: glutamyl-tRNA reductase [Elusimicrobia bacterium]|nr:glutamyl-tRNA reductase [Elusimicrobiota bacterium]